MNRMSEIILGVIGVLTYLFFVVAGAFWVWFFSNHNLLESVIQETVQTNLGEYMAPITEVVTMLSASGWVLIGISVIPIVIGVFSILLTRGNKKTKTAGILFIVTAFLSTAFSFGILGIAAVFYLVAGIMCLTRSASVV